MSVSSVAPGESELSKQTSTLNASRFRHLDEAGLPLNEDTTTVDLHRLLTSLRDGGFYLAPETNLQPA